MRATQRVLTDVETGDKFRLHYCDETHQPSLKSDPTKNPTGMAGGTEVNGFHLTMAFDLSIKINNHKIIALAPMQFYSLKEGEEVTHTRMDGFNKRFKKTFKKTS